MKVSPTSSLSLRGARVVLRLNEAGDLSPENLVRMCGCYLFVSLLDQRSLIQTTRARTASPQRREGRWNRPPGEENARELATEFNSSKPLPKHGTITCLTTNYNAQVESSEQVNRKRANEQIVCLALLRRSPPIPVPHPCHGKRLETCTHPWKEEQNAVSQTLRTPRS